MTKRLWASYSTMRRTHCAADAYSSAPTCPGLAPNMFVYSSKIALKIKLWLFRTCCFWIVVHYKGVKYSYSKFRKYQKSETLSDPSISDKWYLTVFVEENNLCNLSLRVIDTGNMSNYNMKIYNNKTYMIPVTQTKLLPANGFLGTWENSLKRTLILRHWVAEREQWSRYTSHNERSNLAPCRADKGALCVPKPSMTHAPHATREQSLSN
jgi:hypothetical protein